jgi:riboflavin kinase/FMN adenylyltransferase
MKILHGYRNGKELKDPVMAIGIFDGVHIGHMKVLNNVLRKSGPGNDRVILTFDPHPKIVLGKADKTIRIMSLEHRLSIFSNLGFDAAIVINFTDHISMLSPGDFVKKILCHFGTKKVFVGSNFRFGYKQSGTVSDFHSLAFSEGIEINRVNPVKKAGRIVSSTWLRKLISRGELEKASLLLRRPVSVLGTVVGGDKIARQLGFPTANIDPHHEVIPPPGVYAVKVRIGHIIYDGVLNIGVKPTFYGNRLKKRKEQCVEVHISGFSGRLYHRDVEIFFIKRIRGEKKFKTDALLKKRIEKDILAAGTILSDKDLLKKVCWFKLHKYFLKKI